MHVFPNKEIYMINNSINGVRFGDVAKFSICLNGQNDSLEVKATSKDHVNLLQENENLIFYDRFIKLILFRFINDRY